MRLFSYCLEYDYGSAPNPYWGVCTLAICKPKIRRVAEIGDWIAGHGSVDTPHGDLSKHLIFAMQVTEIFTFECYDEYCQTFLPKKIPKWDSQDYRRQVGDCIYHFVNGKIRIRKGIHGKEHKEKDLRGENVLLSDHFYYFGDKAIELPESLYPILHKRQGHKSDANIPYIEEFVNWIENLSNPANKPLGMPIHKDSLLEVFNKSTCIPCSKEKIREE